MEEIWKHIRIDGKLSKYKISNYGNLKSFKYGKPSPIGTKTDSNNYRNVALFTDDGRRINTTIHRLVAEYFLEDYDDTLEVNHKDLDKTNNNISNLEMLSHEDNVEHYVTSEQKKSKSVFKEKDIKNIRNMIDKSMSCLKISKIYKVSTNTIIRIKKKQTYKWVK